MDTLKSFKGYGKMDQTEDRNFRRKSRRRISIIAITVVLLIGIIVGVAVAFTVNKKSGRDETSFPQNPLSTSSAIKAVCSVTRYPDTCFSSLSTAAAANSSLAATDPTAIFNLSLAVASRAISKLPPFLSTLDIPAADKRLHGAVSDCRELLDDAFDRLSESTAILAASGKLVDKISDLKTWLSTTITDMETCLDGFVDSTGGFQEKLRAAMVNSTQFASNSLAIVTGIMEKLHIPINRKLLADVSRGGGGDRFLPEWATAAQRRVLLAGEAAPAANVTVALDGTGNVKTVQEAVDMVPKKDLSTFVIYIKAGEYSENVVIDKNKWNVVMTGDGMYKTIISSNKNFIDGTPTFSTATFAVSGRNFIAKDIGFKNSAGAEKHQAVALRSGSDRSIFYRCSFDAFQDTLYAHSNRQFYRECDIAGTIDFIFGDSAVVFQNCKIMPRQPLPNQANTITAQGKKDPNENTGISLQGCTIAPFDAVTRPTYLGRPWKNYSTTVVMKTEVGSVVDPAGWMPWVFGTVPPDTINYAEYLNTGPGAGVAGRVSWPGYRPAISADEASKYTVASFIDGNEWISGAGVEFEANL